MTHNSPVYEAASTSSIGTRISNADLHNIFYNLMKIIDS